MPQIINRQYAHLQLRRVKFDTYIGMGFSNMVKGLDKKALAAKKFHAIIGLATLGGVMLDFTPIEPIKGLFWSAVINGVIAIPIMAMMMIMAVQPKILGAFVIKKRLRFLGWAATFLMLFTVIIMLIFW